MIGHRKCPAIRKNKGVCYKKVNPVTGYCAEHWIQVKDEVMEILNG